MPIEFGDEHRALRPWQAGVYQIIFNETWFYIGSSVNMKRRLSVWKHSLSKGDFKKNASIKFILPQVTYVRFKVLEFCGPGVDVKERETAHIQSVFQDKHCLNLVPDAVTSKGRKLPLGKALKPRPKKGPVVEKKPVAQFDLIGNLIKVHASIADAAKFSGVKEESIRKSFSNKRLKPRKFLFKPVLPDGSFAEIEMSVGLRPEDIRFILENYKTYGPTQLGKMFGKRESYIRRVVHNRSKTIAPELHIEPQRFLPKPVIQYDKDMNELAIFESAYHAARELPVSVQGIKDVLKGRRKSACGFIFRYK